MSQVANADFFLKTLPLFDAGDDVGMVLSPQSFYNVDTNQDIFNHGNIQFWEYAQHGYDAIGFISCTGAPLSIPHALPAAHSLAAWGLTQLSPADQAPLPGHLQAQASRKGAHVGMVQKRT